MSSPSDPSVVEIGRLTSLASLQLRLGRELTLLGRELRRNRDKQVEWDLRELQFGSSLRSNEQIGMSALTAFLATAWAVRRVLRETPIARIRWDTELQAFWRDIGFLRLVSAMDIMKFPPGMLGGYGGVPPRVRKSTSLLCYHCPEYVPPITAMNENEWKPWKDAWRSKLSALISRDLSAVFAPDDREQLSMRDRLTLAGMENRVTSVATEMVLNAWVWGHDHAFIGLQRTSQRITVSICDGGRGFYRALKDPNTRASKEVLASIESPLDALLIGSLINRTDHGLRGVIGQVMRSGGWVKMYSDSAEVCFEQPLWQDVSRQLEAAESADAGQHDADLLKGAVAARTRGMFKPYAIPSGRPDETQRKKGYVRDLAVSLLGSRLEFQIRFRGVP